MKVVLFCGGQGTRLRDYSETIPKPMVNVGYRPILWNIMKYYAHFGHKDFILCLGYKGDKIKDYFVNYNETISNDFVMTQGGRKIELLSSDIDDWSITFVDTGKSSNIGMRLYRVQKYLKDEEMFLANYADGLTDMYLPAMIEDFEKKPDKVATFMSYKPNQSFHTVATDGNGLVTSFLPIDKTHLWLNTGYFIIRKEFFNYINYGEELVMEPFERLIAEKRLMTYYHKGFWQHMDTFKDKMKLDDMVNAGNTPWAVWKSKKDFKTNHIDDSVKFQ